MKTRIMISLTEEDIIRLNNLSNGYSKSATISEALRCLDEERHPIIQVGFGQSFDKAGSEL